MNINVITGWKILDDEKLQEILDKQFELFLIENFKTLNKAEILFAFRKYGHTVENWGKSLNLVLIGNVLRQYETQRGLVSEYEERIGQNLAENLLPLPKVTDEEILNTAKEIVEAKGNISFINPKAYSILFKQGKINLTEEEKKGIKVRAKFWINDNFKNQNEKNNLLKNEDYLQMLCKKIAVNDYYLKLNVK